MNKKQKATLITWCLATAGFGWMAAKGLDMDRRSLREALVPVILWTATTLIALALGWMFASPKKVN